MKLLSVVIISLIIATATFSCMKILKPKPLSEVLPNSVCEGDCDFRIPDTETVKNASYQGSIKIIFLKDEASITANFGFSYQYLSDQGDYWEDGFKNEIFKGNATYSYDKDDIRIKIKWDSAIAEKLGGNEWIGTGKTEGNSSSTSYSLFLKNVFGEVVTFRMNYY